MSSTIDIPFNNAYCNLGDAFFEQQLPTPVSNPKLIKLNKPLLKILGCSVDNWRDQDAAQVFSGNQILETSFPIAMAYAGHQFGHFNPQLGDGRAILLGEVRSGEDVVGVQLKGSGRTRYSRGGDGRSALGPIIREYLLSEAMHQLGVPTTRALAAVTSGEKVARDRLFPGGLITRAASSFVRVGTFQYFSSTGNIDAIQKLADHVISINFPQVKQASNSYAGLLQEIVNKQAFLIAKWMQFGFIHGVMNTDNMSVAGETIDYGPCAFMDNFSHGKVFSSIDHHGRYAYSRQPPIALWNLTRLAETLVPLIDENTDKAVEIAETILKSFIDKYETEWLACMRAKLGLVKCDDIPDIDDKNLIEALLDLMDKDAADFTVTFYTLYRMSCDSDNDENEFLDLFSDKATASHWLINWQNRVRAQLTQGIQPDEEIDVIMREANPIYIPRNHRVEQAIRAAEDNDDFSLFHRLHEVLENPFELRDEFEQYQHPPEPHETVNKTFCGT